MCGVRVPGLPAVPGGAADPSLVLSWFIDRYVPADRTRIRQAWKAKGYTHVLLSWPDSQAFGAAPQRFRDICGELIADGFYPCPMFCSKDFDLTPSGCRVYVHFQQGYMSYQQPGQFVADFWKLQIGKLTGVLRQKILAQNADEYRYASGGIVDVLQRMAGNFGMPSDSGFGQPFDDVELEMTASDQFNGTCTEQQGDALGQWAIETPAQSGPAGTVSVMGSGNGS